MQKTTNMTSIHKKISKEFWDERYQKGETGWDVGYATTPLVEYFSQLNNKHLKILIPGCGNGYEAEWLSSKGFTEITVIDISHEALERLREKNLPGLVLVQGDFFEHKGSYDLIVEQTFFCALAPGLRKEYINKMYALLKAGGKLIGVLFNREFEGDPPFGGSYNEYVHLFVPPFVIRCMEPCYNSIKPRKDSELFFIIEKPLFEKQSD